MNQSLKTLQAQITALTSHLSTRDSSVSYDITEPWRKDVMKLILESSTIDIFANFVRDTHKGDYQLGTLEVSGVPLISALVCNLAEQKKKPVNGFFVRKSRKKNGLLRMIEGTILPETPVVLIDDFIHTGCSLERAVRILEEKNIPVLGVVCLFSIHKPDSYVFFKQKNIPIHVVHSLDLPRTSSQLLPVSPLWKFESNSPSLGLVIPKSNPVLDETQLYFGSDNEYFWALRQSDGTVVWSYKVGPKIKMKSIFSSPDLYRDYVIFGSYDGNLYCLNKHTGKPNWIFTEADWIGSSPCVAQDLGLVFIGLEFAIDERRGGIVALDIDSGEVIWRDYTHPAMTHASPLYIQETKEVVIGSNEGNIYLYDVRTGHKKWTATTKGGETYEYKKDQGFGKGSIKIRPAYDAVRDYVIVGSIDSHLYVIERKTGTIVFTYEARFAVWSTPYVYRGCVYFTSLDRHCYCVNLNTFELVWKRNLDNTRIFSAPTVIDGKVYVGTDASRLHELDPRTGEQTGYIQLTERITGYPVFNKKTQTLFVPTYANEIVAYKKLEH